MNSFSPSRFRSVILFLPIIFLFVAFSCAGEEYDRQDTFVPEFVPAVDSIDCGSELTISSPQFSFGGAAVAWVSTGTNCNGPLVERSHNYLILLDPPNSFEGADAPTSLPRLGFPGISFSHDGPLPLNTPLPQVGTGVYTSFIGRDYTELGLREWIIEDATTVELTITGDEEGDYVSGTIDGWLTEYDGINPGTTYPLNGSFCVPITLICNE